MRPLLVTNWRDGWPDAMVYGLFSYRRSRPGGWVRSTATTGAFKVSTARDSPLGRGRRRRSGPRGAARGHDHDSLARPTARQRLDGIGPKDLKVRRLDRP